MRVHELQPGMVFESDLPPIPGFPDSGTVICTAGHPIFPGFMLVVWKMSDGTMSFDALSPMQELPTRWIGQNLSEMRKAFKEAIGLKHG